MLEIRPARPEDAPTLSALALAAKAHWGYSPEVMAAWRDELAISVRTLRQPSAVAVLDGVIAGFYTLSRATPDWELDNLWVDPRAMRRGVGRALLAHALDCARAAGSPRVCVDSDPNAAAFYRACGALPAGSKPAPIPGDPGRERPQLVFESTEVPRA